MGVVHLSPDGATAIYRADQNEDGLDELFSVPVSGGEVTRISDPDFGDLFSFSISPAGSTVVYETSGGIDEIYSAPLTGGEVIRLNAPLKAGEFVSSFQISPDSSTVVYTTAPEFSKSGSAMTTMGDELPSVRLFNVPASGGPATQISPAFDVGRGIVGFLDSPDSNAVVYGADQDEPGVVELFGIPIAGGDPLKLNAPLVSGGDVRDARFTPDGDRIVYTADQDTDNVDEVYSLPRAGLARPDFMFSDGFEPVLE